MRKKATLRSAEKVSCSTTMFHAEHYTVIYSRPRGANKAAKLHY